MKICNRCEETKPLESFFKDKNNKTDGRYSICKDCKAIAVQSWRENNRDQYNAKMRQYRGLNLEKFRKSHLKRNYNVTPEEYDQKLINQGNVCAICAKPNPSTKRLFAMDHNHKTGKARGVLCYGCNRALHTLEKDGLLEKAMAYLQKWKEK